MAKRNIKKKELNIDTHSDGEYRYPISQTDAMTGGENRYRHLYYQLKTSIFKAREIDIAVSFLMESGVRLILNDLKLAINKGVRIRLLTGNYLGITQPSALYLVKQELGNKVDLRFYNDKNRSFHPKAYIFRGDFDSEIYIGSSNLSRSALTSGIEWNYRFSNKDDRINYDLFSDEFNDLFAHHSIIIDDEELKNYSKNWKRPKVQQDIDKLDVHEKREEDVIDMFQPRGIQIEALYALENSRKEGADRGLVYAATGERVIIVTGCINALVSRVSGTFIKNNSCIA